MAGADLGKQIGDLQTALNIVWTLITGFLVMFMQAGFALVETGLTRAKNVGHTMAMNFLVYAIGIVGFWSVGFALQMGGVGPLSTFGDDPTLSRELVIQIAGKDFGLCGFKGFFLSPEIFTPGVAALFLFQLVFMDTAATIPTGAGAERWRFTSFFLFSLVVSTLIYPVFANWAWGGGWLSALGKNFGLGHGYVDFAGSSVVHMCGGVMAFAVAKTLGPRHGKFDSLGRARAVPGHSIPLVVLGTFILAFGWFGFNAGSTLAGSETRISVIATNTMLASASGPVAAYLYTKFRFGAPDVSMMCNGMLAGLVAITAPCAFVTAPSAILIGAVAGVLVIRSTLFLEQVVKLDDPVGAVSVHGTCGAWGILALGLFADGRYGEGFNGVNGGVRGLFYGDSGQLGAECIGLLANAAWVGGVAFGALRVIGAMVGNRAPVQDQVDGLDVAEMGGPGYAPDALLEPAASVSDDRGRSLISVGVSKYGAS
jgi:ammonium transporter, Amt family